MRTCLLALLALLLAACDMGFLNPFARGDDFEDVVIVNATDEPFYYLAIEVQTSHLVDLNPYLDPDDTTLPRVEPGSADKVNDIMGYEEGDDVRFFFYALREVQGGETTWRSFHHVDVTDKELRARDGRVVVRELE